MTITFANKLTIIHKGDGLQFIAMAPDVCKTPSPGGPIPVPYPNLASSSDLSDGTQTIKVEGNPAAIASSNIMMSTGDEAGSAGGGIVSNKIKGKVTWLLYSMDVKFEGKGVVRFLDDNLHNGNMANTNGKDLGQPGGGGGPPPILCDNCGKDVDDPSHTEPRAMHNPRDRAAEKVPGRTKAAITNSCKKKPFTGVAGDGYHPLQPHTFTALIKNVKYGTAIQPAAPTDVAPAGNCAEQKAMYSAIQGGGYPPAEGCSLSLSVRRERRDGKQIAVPPCDTCKRVLTAITCQNPPKGAK